MTLYLLWRDVALEVMADEMYYDSLWYGSRIRRDAGNWQGFGDRYGV